MMNLRLVVSKRFNYLTSDMRYRLGDYHQILEVVQQGRIFISGCESA